mmetsp:Transcript_28899/g.74666  ORF Transcript_28899/g.74666 Transcript_28899/m.74666 type:complete len:237 (+) Transcript_28899:2243-2953(+)
MPLLMPMRTRRPRNTRVAPGWSGATGCHLNCRDSRTVSVAGIGIALGAGGGGRPCLLSNSPPLITLLSSIMVADLRVWRANGSSSGPTGTVSLAGLCNMLRASPLAWAHAPCAQLGAEAMMVDAAERSGFGSLLLLPCSVDCPPTAHGLVPFCALQLEGRALPAAVCGYSPPTLTAASGMYEGLVYPAAGRPFQFSPELLSLVCDVPLCSTPLCCPIELTDCHFLLWPSSSALLSS